MYRCTECKTEYEQLPEYCDCGNDTFEEVYEEQTVEEYEEEQVPVRKTPSKKHRLTEEELQELKELEAEKLEKKKSLIVFGAAVFISILLILCPPHIKKKSEKVADALKSNPKIELPSISAIWLEPNGSEKNTLPLLNANLKNISQDLHQYLVDIGNEFNRKWVSQTVVGKGEAKIEFTIDKLGVVKSSLIVKSGNDDLDDSVLLLLSKVTNLEPPPPDYKGERIIMSFTVDSSTGLRRLSYPSSR